MDPYALEIQANTKDMTERPSTWIKGPICSTYRDLLARSATMDFMHPWVKMSVKREAEMGQTQAGRPRRGRPAYNFQLQTDTTIHRHLEKIKSVHEKFGAKRQKSLSCLKLIFRVEAK